MDESKLAITNWLQGHPKNATAYASIHLSPPLNASRKRKVLQEMSENVKRRKLPRKGGHDAAYISLAPDQHEISQGKESGGLFDIYATPRASVNAAWPLNPAGHTGSGRGRDTSPSQSSISNSSVARSKSPTKRIGDLQLLPIKIHFANFDNKKFPLSIAANGLYLRLKRIFSKSQLIPNEVKAKAEDLISKFEIDESNFFTSPHPLLSPQPQGSFNEEDTWILVAEVLKRARMCEEDLAPEAHWNTQVHARVFDIVLEGWREERNLWYLDITTARINSNSVSKLVDYAFVLTPSLDLHERVTNTLRGRDELTINHTKAEHLRYKPIAISFETKRPGTDEEGANVQLGVWAEAHFQRLQQLSNISMGRLPILPQVLVQGHDWRLKIASTTLDGKVVLHGDLIIGDTRSQLGIYKLIAALRCLSDWAVDEFQAWFLENCLI